MKNNQIIIKCFQELHFHFKDILNFKPILIIGTCTREREREREREKQLFGAVFPSKYVHRYGKRTYRTSFLCKRQEDVLALCSPPPLTPNTNK
jgi:hypothetical protein